MITFVTYDEIQVWFRYAFDEDVPLGTLRYWASAEKWTKYGTRRDRRWDLDEARATYLKYRNAKESEA